MNISAEANNQVAYCWLGLPVGLPVLTEWWEKVDVFCYVCDDFID